MLAVMQSLAEEHVTMLVVTHEMGFARRAADWVAVMDKGEIVEQGEPGLVLGPGAGERTRAFLRHVHTG